MAPRRRPDIIVHVSSETLGGGTPGISETGRGTFLTADEVERISCDANSDQGRVRSRQPASRCRPDPASGHPGAACCDLRSGHGLRLSWLRSRLANWCDAHHLHHWSKGGETSSRIWSCSAGTTMSSCIKRVGGSRASPGALTFYRPDGTRLGDAPPFSALSVTFLQDPAPGPPTPYRFIEMMWEMQRQRGP